MTERKYPLYYDPTTGKYFKDGRKESAFEILMNPDAVKIETLGSPTYTTMKDWMNITQASGKTTGGVFTDNGDGTLKVGAGTGLIRASDSAIAEILAFNWAEDTSVSLTDGVTNYIFVSYHATTPPIASSTSKASANNRSILLLGKVFREGNALHMVEAGMSIIELAKAVLGYLTEVNGEVVRASGGEISESGERYLVSENSVQYAGLTRLTASGINTSVGGVTMETYYYDGDLGTPAWVESTESQVDNTYYNDVATGLTELTPNKYSTHYIYIDPDGHIMRVWGQGDYTIAQALLAQPPIDLPGHVEHFAFYAAKLIVQKSAANLYSIENK